MTGAGLRLSADYYEQTSVELAPLLVGKLLCRRLGEQVLRIRITETEAYYTELDTACHAHKGRTPRTNILYGHGGIAYVYLCYGIHSLLNVVCGAEGSPQAVLLRGVEGYAGPGKLTKALSINCGHNGENLVTSSALWLEEDGCHPTLRTDKRVGIAYAAQEDIDKPWRFILVP